MADRPDYDVYLNGLGYMLARDGEGRVMGGACRELGRDPLQYYLNAEQRWNEVVFRFGAGAGAIEYDGTHRYRWGENIDTRAGILRRGPAFHGTRAHPLAQRVRPEQGITITDEEISNAGGAVDGFAVQFTAPYTWWVSNVAVLVKRDPDESTYGTAAVFTVELWSDVADTPNAQLVSDNVAFQMTDEEAWSLYSCEPWAAGEFFWLQVDFGTYAVTAGTKYWLVIRNAQAQPLYWGRTPDETAMISTWNGAAWAAGTADQDSPLWQLGSHVRNGAFVSCLERFRGLDGESRLYAGMGSCVSVWNPVGRWDESRNKTVRVSDLCVFNGRLFAALGLATDLENSTGATAATVWAAVANERAICFGVHDGILWKAGGGVALVGGALVTGSLTGIGAYGAWITVGDPGTIVTALCSHGGALFAAKEEGIYQIDYPDTYPATGNPTANLVLDFKTDRCLRPWLVSWQGGLYFPGTAAVYEWKNDVLRDIWTDRVDEGAQELSQARPAMSSWTMGEAPQFTPARKWAAVESVPEDRMGFFQRGIGTTRGLVVSLTSPHLAKAGIWWYDGRGWHPMGPTIADDDSELNDPLTEGIYADYILALFMDSYGAGKGRLWFGCGYDVPYWVMPTWTRDRTQLEGVDFNPAWSVDLPVYDGGAPDLSKYFHSVQIMAKNPGTDPRVLVYFMIDGDRSGGVWTELGDFVEDDVFQEIGIGLVGRNIRFRLTGYHGDDDEALLEVEAVRLLYQVLPETMETYQVVLRAANQLRARNAVTCDRTGAEIKGELMALLEEEAPWGYADPLQAERVVWALDVSTAIVSTQDPAGQSGPPVEAQVTVKMIKTEIELVLINALFTHDLEGWEAFGSPGPVWQGGMGSPAAGCVYMTIGMLPVAHYLQKYVEVPVAGNYVLTCKGRTPDASDTMLVVVDDGVVVDTYLSDTMTFNLANTWEDYQSAEFALPRDSVRVWVGLNGSNKDVYVDTIRLVRVKQ